MLDLQFTDLGFHSSGLFCTSVELKFGMITLYSRSLISLLHSKNQYCVMKKRNLKFNKIITFSIPMANYRRRTMLCCDLSSWYSVISYPGHFVPKSFRTILVISYPLLFSIWSFRTQFSYFVPISYPVWSFRTYFYYFLENRFGHFVPIFLLFRTQVISYPKSFRTHFSHFVPRSFRTHFQTRYELTWVRNDFPFCCNLLLPD